MSALHALIAVPFTRSYMRPTQVQVTDCIELVGAGVSWGAAIEEAFPDLPGTGRRPSSFFSVTDDGIVVAWDTCAGCHNHIKLCGCREIVTPEYIRRWQAVRRGLIEDLSSPGKFREPLPDRKPRTPVVVDPPRSTVGCHTCGQTVTLAMAQTGAYVEMGGLDDATSSLYAISNTDGQWTCSDCINKGVTDDTEADPTGNAAAASGRGTGEDAAVEGLTERDRHEAAGPRDAEPSEDGEGAGGPSDLPA